MLGKLQSARRSGVARNLALVMIAVLGASVAGGAVVLFPALMGTPAGGTTSSSSSVASTSQAQPVTTSATTSSSSASSSASSSTTGTTSSGSSASTATCSLNGTYPSSVAGLTSFLTTVSELYSLNGYTAKALFGNFSQMTVRTGSSVNGSALGTPLIDSFAVVGRPVINSLRYYQVNFTLSSNGASYAQTALFAPNGTATSVNSTALGDYTGASAAKEGDGLVSTFLYELKAGVYAESVVTSPSLRILNTTTVSLGPTSVKVTYYTMNSLPLTACGSTITKLVIGLGAIPGTSLPIASYSDEAVSMQGTTIDTTTTIVSLAVATP